MNYWNNQFYVNMLLVSNLVAIVQLVAAARWPRTARMSFFLLFAWASWINWRTSQQDAPVYLEYANYTWSKWYQRFIEGWFAEHIKIAVGFIACGQALIAISMLFKGWFFKIGCIGAIIFLLAILPLGFGAAFPCTLIMAIAVYILFKKSGNEFIWTASNALHTQ